MSDYNHFSFPLDLEVPLFEAFRDHLKAGDRAPRASLVDVATGETVELRKLWRRRPLMIEFGSVT